MTKQVLCSIFIIFAFPSFLLSNTDFPVGQEIKDLSHSSSDLKLLKANISKNLRETARTGKLAEPLYFVRYRLKKNEHFYYVMAKMSQNMDTLSTLNQLPHPGAVGSGDVMFIPSARGIFVQGSSRTALAKKFNAKEDALVSVSKDRWFIPGGVLAPAELKVFRGDDFIKPLKNLRVTSKYGYRRDPFSNRSTFHGGIDLGAPSGTAVYASREGKVVRSGRAGGYGNLVVISHKFGYSTYYGHLSRILVKKGQKIKAGEKIGMVGSTGKANGPHLHFEVRKAGRQKNPSFIHR
ncbi:MAG: M23 family metallopeptidase [Spirochaetia bacterium]|nr:M23 family metallopeptidase [Spirochaetia bacterium]